MVSQLLMLLFVLLAFWAFLQFGLPRLYRRSVGGWMRRRSGMAKPAVAEPSLSRARARAGVDASLVARLASAANRRTACFLLAGFTCCVAQVFVLLAFVEPNPKAGAPAFTLSSALLAFLFFGTLPLAMLMGRAATSGSISWITVSLIPSLAYGGVTQLIVTRAIDNLSSNLIALGALAALVLFPVLVGYVSVLGVLSIQRLGARMGLSSYASGVCISFSGLGLLTGLFFWNGNGSPRSFAMLAPSLLLPVILVACGRYLNAGTCAGPLLYLRTFGYEGRSNRLLRQIGRLWLETGPVRLIAGCDVASTTLDAADLSAFLTGRLGGRFERDAASVARRLERGEQGTDRHDVEVFRCLDDNWATTVGLLADSATLVVMDLRNFKVTNVGCATEIGILVRAVPLGRVAFLVDSTTDIASAKAIGKRAAVDVDADAAHHELPFVEVRSESRAEVRALLERLLSRAQQ